MGTPARPRRRCHVRSRTTAVVVAAAAVAVAAGAAVALPLAAAAPMMDPAPSAPTGVVTHALPSGAPPTGVRSVRKPAPAAISAAVAAAMSAAAAREATTTGTAAAARRPPQPPQPPPPQPAAPPLPLPPPPLLPPPPPPSPPSTSPPPPPPSPPSTSPPPLPLLRPAEPLAGASTRAAALAHARRGWAEVVAARAACALAERRHHVPSYEVNGGEGQEQADLVLEEIIDDISRVMDACEWSGRGDTWPDEQLAVDEVGGGIGSGAAGDTAPVAAGGGGQARQASLLLRFLRLLHYKLLQVQGKAVLATPLPAASSPSGDGGGEGGTASDGGVVGEGGGGSVDSGGRADPVAAAAVGGEVETLRRTSRSASEAYERLRRVAAQSLQWHLRLSNVTAPQRYYITRHMNNIYLY